MRRLGSALGVEAMSLYRHFLSKAVLLEAVVGRLLAELLLPVPGSAPWQDAFRALARDYRQLLLRHPNAIPLLATLQLSNPAALGPAGADRWRGTSAAAHHAVGRGVRSSAACASDRHRVARGASNRRRSIRGRDRRGRSVRPRTRHVRHHAASSTRSH